MKHFLRILLLLAGSLLAPLADAGDLVVSRAVLEDAGGTLDIAEVVGREFVPVGPTLSKGLTDSAYWLRLRVRAPASGSAVVLFIRQPFLNEIRLYEAAAGNPAAWKTKVTGNHYAYEQRERASTSLGFVVDVVGPEATYYLRLKTRSPSQLTVEALTPGEADRLDQQFDLLEVFFATAMLLLLGWAIQSYFLDRLPVVGLFAIHQTVFTLYGIAITGYLAPWLPVRFPQLVEWSTAVPYCAVSFTTLLFCRTLFKPYQPPPRLLRGLNLMLLIFPVQLVAIALGHIPFAVIINAVLIRVSWWYFVLVAFSLRQEHAPSRRLLQTVFLVVTLIFTLFWLSGIGSPSDTKIHLYGRQTLIANSLIIGGLFAALLNARLRRLLEEAQRSALDLAMARQTLESERTLKERAEIQARTDYLTGLFNRRHFVELAERELVRSIRYARPFTLMMIDVDHFKSINDQWGHSAGDLVLQKVASLIGGLLRNVDICGRIGGEEFAIAILETDGANARDVAQRLCTTVAEARIAVQEEACIQVTISIGLVELGGRDIAFDRLLNAADRLMYSAKQQGRNRVVVGECCVA
jgi:diguanylate cyclase (GGDEF)-like protein